jgi:hypothetical protein
METAKLLILSIMWCTMSSVLLTCPIVPFCWTGGTAKGQYGQLIYWMVGVLLDPPGKHISCCWIHHILSNLFFLIIYVNQACLQLQWSVFYSLATFDRFAKNIRERKESGTFRICLLLNYMKSSFPKEWKCNIGSHWIIMWWWREVWLDHHYFIITTMHQPSNICHDGYALDVQCHCTVINNSLCHS